MMIWLPTALGDMGVEHGVLRAPDAQRAMSFEAARDQLARMAEEALAAAQQEAERIVAQAHEQAEAMIADAQARIEAACEQGYANGEMKAATDWHERQAVHAIRRSGEARGLNEKLAEVVTTAVERIVQTEGRAALYQRALKNVQHLARNATSLTLRVGPSDLEAAREGVASVPDLQEADVNVEVLVDPSLPPGSCLFESELGAVDASLQIQLNGLRMAMERAVRHAVDEEGTRPPTPPAHAEIPDDGAEA